MNVRFPHKRVLVTGGAGFLGSHLCRRLLDEGNEVICLDNFYTGNKWNIDPFFNHPHFEFIRHNVIDPILLEVDEIYNLACAASPGRYQLHPIETLRTSVDGMHNMLELATRRNIKVLQASTSEVYGDPIVHPQREDYLGNVNPIGPRACYDEGKRAAETLCFDYHRLHKTKIKVVRIFNTYGPNMALNDGRAVSHFAVQVLSKKPITIYGDGSQTRSFCYVDDLIDGFIKFMATDDASTGPLNLGNPHEITILELANRILEQCKSKTPIEFHPLPADDPVKRCPDITKAKALLGWQPKVPLETGLAKTIEYFKAIL